jgi:tripartite-type tricarboxylate transporter receptor subunit TctC
MYVSRFLILCAVASLLLLQTLLGANAQQYPSRPISIVVPVAPGGVADVVTRVFGMKLGQASGATVVVENKTGGASIPGTLTVARAQPDGYTLLTGFHGPLSILQHLQTLPYDPAKELVPVVHLISVPNILVVNPSIPANNLSELITYAKANPGKLTYASQGAGTTGHLAGEMFKLATGTDITHVPYRGAAPAIQDLLGGQVSMMFDVVALAEGAIKEGRLRTFGVATKDRIPIFPGVPTLREQGVPIEMTAWFGLMAPAGTPREVILWLNERANKLMAEPDVRERFAAQGATLPLGTPEEFGAFIASETKKFGDVIQRGNITMR